VEMFIVENNMSAVKQTIGVRASTGADTRQLKVLCERLLRVQPQSEPLLKRLLARSRRLGSQRAFAPIQDGRCSACNMRIAIARIQKAKAGEFINCANCIRFLYYDPR
jgi:predicted  nucleic acid-binding Zn-ribbon protein